MGTQRALADCVGLTLEASSFELPAYKSMHHIMVVSALIIHNG